MKQATALLWLCLASVVGVNASSAQVLLQTLSDSRGAVGRAFAGVGDFDGDGGADLASTLTSSTTQRALVFSGTTGVILREWRPPIGYRFRGEVSRIGDVDGDGLAEILVSLEQIGSGFGAIAVYGAAGDAPRILIDGTSVSFGNPLEGGADVGEPVPGFLVGDDVHLELRAGDDGRLLRSIPIPSTFQVLAADWTGDIDGDGVDDILLGSRSSEQAPLGLVQVLSGLDGTELWQWSGSDDEGRIGESLAGLGDFDGDEWPDFAVGFPFGPSPKHVRVFSGRSLSEIVRIDERSPGRYFGSATAAAGDIDADGFRDIAVMDFTTDGRPRVLVFQGPDGTYSWLRGGFAGGVSAATMESAGDINFNGAADLAIGLPQSELEGEIRIFGGVCGTVDFYGEGCAGSGGIVPLLRSDFAACPSPGSTLRLHVREVIGGATGALLLGLNGPGDRAAFGCRLLVEPPFFVGASFYCSGPSGVPGSGQVSLDLEIPSTPAITGLVVHAQAWVVDLGAPKGIAFTNGAAIEIE